MNSTNVETQTIYILTDDGVHVMLQVVYSNVRLVARIAYPFTTCSRSGNVELNNILGERVSAVDFELPLS